MVKRFLECGKIVTTHGIRGEVKLQPWGGDPDELCNFDTLFLEDGAKPLKIDHARVHKGMVLLKIAEIDTPEQAQLLRGKIVYIDRELDTLEEGQYYIQDLMGLSVYDVDSGKLYGTICDITETGANDVYHIKFEDGSIQLIPVIPDVIIHIDIDADRMEIRPLKGLFDDAEV